MKESIALALIALAFALGYLCGHAHAPVQKYVWASGATLYNVEIGHLCRVDQLRRMTPSGSAVKSEQKRETPARLVGAVFGHRPLRIPRGVVSRHLHEHRVR